MAKKKNLMPQILSNTIANAPSFNKKTETSTFGGGSGGGAGAGATDENKTGSYNKEKGGFMTNEGKLFPTTNPDFVPNPNTEQIEFMSNGGVRISPKGSDQTIELSKEEYKNQLNYETGKGASLTNKLKEVEAARRPDSLNLSPEEIARAEAQATETPIDKSQALTAGTLSNVPSLLKNVGVGAGAGFAVAGHVGAAVGGVLGAIKGVWGGVQNNIEKQQRGEIAASKDVLSAARTNMRQLITLASKDPGNAAEYMQAYKRQLAMVYTAQAKIKLETNGDLNKFMEDGTEVLSDFELFLMPGGYADIQGQKLQIALMGGVMPEFTAEDLAYENENI